MGHAHAVFLAKLTKVVSSIPQNKHHCIFYFIIRYFLLDIGYSFFSLLPSAFQSFGCGYAALSSFVFISKEACPAVMTGASRTVNANIFSSSYLFFAEDIIIGRSVLLKWFQGDLFDGFNRFFTYLVIPKLFLGR